MTLEKRIVKLTDLMEDINEVNKMIQLHSENSEGKISEFMLEQYKSKKDKLVSYLIDELLKPSVRSPKSFSLITKILKNYYPNLNNDAKNDVDHKFLEKLELLIA